MYIRAVELYIGALLDIVNVLEKHREARSAFDPAFLFRVVGDGFLQTVTDHDKIRIVDHSRPQEEFLLWQGPVPDLKRNWNCIGWIFPFYTTEEIDRSYEIVTRAELAKKSWAAFRQFWLSCRLRFQETPLNIPTNLVKVRVMGEECQTAMRTLEKHPPNLRYVTKTLLDRLPPSNYARKSIRIQLVVGEQLEPYVQTPR